MKDGAISKQDAPRSVPVALRDELKAKLEEMEKQGTLAKVEEPTDWVNSTVHVKKPGKRRVCLDQRELNKHNEIPQFRLPTIDDVTSILGKDKVFTVLDAKDGFLQVKLDENSAKMTTFHTPFGQYTNGSKCHLVHAARQKSFRDMCMRSKGIWKVWKPLPMIFSCTEVESSATKP